MVFITGREYLYNGMNDYVVKSFFTSLGISIFLIALIMIYFLKSVKWGLLSLIPNLVPIAFGAVIMRLIDRPVDVGTIIVASVCFSIAIDDTIHMIFEYSRYHKQGDSFEDAMLKVYRNSGIALITTTLILVGGFSTFVFSDFIPNWNFGVFSSLVMLFALFIDLTFLPVLFKIFKRN